MDNEICAFLVGESGDDFWKGDIRSHFSGSPTSVEFDPVDAYRRSLMLKKTHQLLGFYHTHPTFPAIPSARDEMTMNAWCDSLGKSLLCLIEGTDGLRAWAFFPSKGENPKPMEVVVERFYYAYVGTQAKMKSSQKDDRNWWEDHQNLAKLLSALDSANLIQDDCVAVITFLTRPWEWTPEWQWLEATGDLTFFMMPGLVGDYSVA